jgi:hypothetical protein
MTNRKTALAWQSIANSLPGHNHRIRSFISSVERLVIVAFHAAPVHLKEQALFVAQNKI